MSAFVPFVLLIPAFHSRGEHPFDYPDESKNSNMQKTGVSVAESQRPPVSQRSMASEEVVKTRIIKCSVEFTNVWDNMLKGSKLLRYLHES